MSLFFRLFTGYLLQVIPFSYLSFFPYFEQVRFSKRKTAVLTALLLCGLAVLFAAAGCYLAQILPAEHIRFDAVNAVFFVTLIPCLVWYLYAVRVIWQKKLFIFSFALMSALTITSVGNIVSDIITLPGVEDYLPYRSWSLPIMFALTAAIMPVLVYVIRRCYKPVKDSSSPRESLYLCSLSLFLFVILGSGLSFISYSNIYNPMTLFLYAALLMTIFLVYTIFFKLMAISHEKLKIQQEANQTRCLLTIQQEQHRRIDQSIKDSRKMRHDLRHHMVVIQGFLNSGDTAQAQAYVENCMASMSRFETTRVCANEIVNAVVCHYKSLAAEQNIDFSIHIAIPDKTGICDTDISTLLGNLLENAVDAAKPASNENRFIRLNITYSGSMLAVTVDNGFDGMVNMDCGRYRSTKSQHTGIGLQSIEDIAVKYNGGVEFSHKNQEFHSSVMLGMNC